MKLARRAREEKDLNARALNGEKENKDELVIKGVAFKVPKGKDM